MAIKYPIPGRKLTSTDAKRVDTNDKSKNLSKMKTFGMLFENDLNISNDYYIAKDIAIIHKKPTPVQIVKVNYPKRSSAKITEAYYKTPSTTDYTGIYKGYYIDYEAKETVKNFFPYAHIFLHQLNHLKACKKHGGLAFVIIYFRITNEVILIDIDKFLEEMETKTRKSITVERAKEIGFLAPLGYTPPIDYLKAVDIMYEL